MGLNGPLAIVSNVVFFRVFLTGVLFVLDVRHARVTVPSRSPCSRGADSRAVRPLDRQLKSRIVRSSVSSETIGA